MISWMAETEGRNWRLRINVSKFTIIHLALHITEAKEERIISLILFLNDKSMVSWEWLDKDAYGAWSLDSNS